MNKESAYQRFISRRQKLVGTPRTQRDAVIERYLPKQFSTAKAGWPPFIEAIMQWEFHHTGRILIARELFLDKSPPLSYEGRVQQWHQCHTLIETASNALDDLGELIEWGVAEWDHDCPHQSCPPESTTRTTPTVPAPCTAV